MKLIDAELLNRTSAQARTDDRLRKNYNFHERPDDPANRLLNALEPGSYLPAHRHLNPAKDEAIVDAYVQDPACSFRFTLNGYANLFGLIRYVKKPAHNAAIPKQLPIILLSGTDDPVGSYGKAVRQVYQNWKQQGIADVSCKLYPTDRHEILNETDRDVVYADIAAWLERHL